jgi:hypothetical protein
MRMGRQRQSTLPRRKFHACPDSAGPSLDPIRTPSSQSIRSDPRPLRLVKRRDPIEHISRRVPARAICNRRLYSSGLPNPTPASPVTLREPKSPRCPCMECACRQTSDRKGDMPRLSERLGSAHGYCRRPQPYRRDSEDGVSETSERLDQLHCTDTKSS